MWSSCTAGDFSLTDRTPRPHPLALATILVNHGGGFRICAVHLARGPACRRCDALTIPRRRLARQPGHEYAGTAHVASTDATDLLRPTDSSRHPHRLARIRHRAVHSAIVNRGRRTIAATPPRGRAHAPASRRDAPGHGRQLAADVPATVTVTVRDAFGNPVTAMRTLTSCHRFRGAAVADVTFTPRCRGRRSERRVLHGRRPSILVNDRVNEAVGGSAADRVNHGSRVRVLALALPAGALAGEPLPLSIEAVDPTETGGLTAGSARVTPRRYRPLPRTRVQRRRAHGVAGVITDRDGTVRPWARSAARFTATPLPSTWSRRRSRVASSRAPPSPRAWRPPDRDRETRTEHGAVVHRDGELHLITDPLATLPAPYTFTTVTPATRFPA